MPFLKPSIASIAGIAAKRLVLSLKNVTFSALQNRKRCQSHDSHITTCGETRMVTGYSSLRPVAFWTWIQTHVLYMTFARKHAESFLTRIAKTWQAF